MEAGVLGAYHGEGSIERIQETVWHTDHPSQDANAEEWPMLLNHPASSWAKRIEKGLDDWTSRFKIFVDGGINTKLQTKEEESRGQSVAEVSTWIAQG